MAFIKYNRSAAKAAGLTDEQIDKYLEEQRAKGNEIQIMADAPEPSQASPPESATQGRSLLAKALPIIGGIGGGILGAPLGPAGIIAGGAAGSGLGEGAAQVVSGEDINVADIGKETALGGVGGLAGMGIGRVLGLGGKVAAGAAKNVAKGSVRGGVHFAPTAYKNAAEAGVNLEDSILAAAREAGIKPGAKLVDEMVDRTVGSGAGKQTIKGFLTRDIEDAEKAITETVKIAGNNYRISADDMVKSIREAAKQSSAELGKTGTNKTQWAAIIDDVTKKYKNGFTLKQGMQTSRYANEKFGKGIFAEAGDVNAALAQKIEADAIRNAVKARFPKVAAALEKQQRDILLREGFKMSAAQNASKGTGFGKVNPLNPLGIMDVLLNNQRAASAATNILNRGAGEATTTAAAATPSVLSRVLQGGAGQATSRALLGGEQAASTQPSALGEAGVLPGMASDMTQERSITIQGNTITESQLNQAILEATAVGQTKMATQLEAIYERAFPEAEGADYTEADKKLLQARDIAVMAMQGLDAGGFETGIIPGAASALNELLGTQREDVTKFKSDIAAAKSNMRTALIGAGQTESEAKNLVDLMFDLNQPKPVLRARLSAFINQLNNYADKYTGGPTSLQVAQ